MADAATRAAPFSRAVFQSIRKLYPESLADKSWDNTGLLLEAPFNPQRRQANSVLLTIDLTRAVADEAITRKSSVVIAYHPIIFKGLKALTLGNSQQNSLLRLAAEGISIYSPHTAFDSAPGGINDWLADIVSGSSTSNADAFSPPAESDHEDAQSENHNFQKRPVFLLTHQPSLSTLKDNELLQLNSVEHERKPIVPFDNESQPGAGQGRIVKFREAQPLSSLIQRIAKGVGNPKGFPIAIPQTKSIDEIDVKSVGICAGSGAGLLSPLHDVDLLFTGEMPHHDALAAIERGQVVISLFHSNTERGFLHSVLRAQLQEQLQEDWDALRENEQKTAGKHERQLMEALEDDTVLVEVSQVDRDPYGIVIGTSQSD